MSKNSIIASSTTRDQISALYRLRLALDVLFWRQGLLWPATGSLIIAAGIFLLAEIRPTWNQVVAAQKTINSDIVSPATTDVAQLHNIRPTLALEEVLPLSDQSDKDARSLYRLAAKHGIVLQRSDFTTTDETRNGVTRVQIAAPVTTTYPALREFLEAFLLSTPHATVDQLTFQRENVSQVQVNAKLKLSWWFKTGKSKPLGMQTHRQVGTIE